MNKEEAKITPKIMKWFRETCYHSAPFEIKHTHGSDIFILKDLAVHQKQWLQSCNSKYGCIWKIPDQSTGHNPFDGFFYKNSAAYVIIVYPSIVIAIHMSQYEKIKENSLSITTAKKLARFKVLLSDL